VSAVEIKVPDIGDFKDVEIIEVLVKPGDAVTKEQSLITVESDKASMEIPAPSAGTVRELKVKLGDKISEGSTILLLEPLDDAPAAASPPQPTQAPATAAAPTPTESAPATPAPAPSRFTGSVDLECEVVVLGSGPGGYSAAFRAADLGKKVVLVERYATLGGVCLNVGCIPSKALLHVASVIDEAAHFPDLGVTFGKPSFDLAKLRAHKDKVVGKLTSGLTAMAKMRKVTVLRGVGTFADPNHLAVATAEGTKNVRFDFAIIAAGSQAVHLPFVPDDPRIVDSTGALNLPSIPQRLLGHAELFRGRIGDVDDASGHIGTTIIDAHRHRLASRDIGHAQLCAERQRRMRGRQFAAVEGLAIRGLRAFRVVARKTG